MQVLHLIVGSFFFISLNLRPWQCFSVHVLAWCRFPLQHYLIWLKVVVFFKPGFCICVLLPPPKLTGNVCFLHAYHFSVILHFFLNLCFKTTKGIKSSLLFALIQAVKLLLIKSCWFNIWECINAANVFATISQQDKLHIIFLICCGGMSKHNKRVVKKLLFVCSFVWDTFGLTKTQTH